jgi:TPR repeat protein
MRAIVAAALMSQNVSARPADRAQAAYDHKNYPTALKLWLPRATRGEMQAQLAIGKMYLGGIGVKQNDPSAMKWLLKAANHGSPEAQDLVGQQYDRRAWTTAEFDEAVRWFLRSANQGYRLGMAHLIDARPFDNQDTYFWLSLLARSDSSWQKQLDFALNLTPADEKAAADKRLHGWKAVPERP